MGLRQIAIRLIAALETYFILTFEVSWIRLDEAACNEDNNQRISIPKGEIYAGNRVVKMKPSKWLKM